MQFSEQVAWIKPLGVYYALGLDGIGITLVLLVTIVTPLVIIASWNDFDGDGAAAWVASGDTTAPPPKYDSRVFFALVLAVESCALFLFLATDVFLFYVFFEVILIPMYFLIGGFGGARRSYAAAKFLIFGLLGGFVMLASVIGLYVLSVQAGPASYLLSDLSQLDIATGTGRWLFLGFMFAFAIKAPLVPLHTWLPDAAEESSPGGATMMVGVMDKIGTFGMIRFCLGLFPEASQWATPVVLVLAVISILYGAILAIGSRDLMRLIAYTSISHFGFIVLGIFAFTSQSMVGSTLYMLNHGLSTAGLFLVVGYLIKRRGSRDVYAFGGVQKVAPVAAAPVPVRRTVHAVAAGSVQLRVGVHGAGRHLQPAPRVRRGLDPGHRAGRALHLVDVPAHHDRSGHRRRRADDHRRPERSGASRAGPAGDLDPAARGLPEADARHHRTLGGSDHAARRSVRSTTVGDGRRG